MENYDRRKEFLRNLEKIDLGKGIERVVHIINSEFDKKKLNFND